MECLLNYLSDDIEKLLIGKDQTTKCAHFFQKRIP